MILYFDTFITDTPLTKKGPIPDNVRSKSSIYSMPKKIDIVKYTLSSYSVYPWSNVYIKYEIEDKSLVPDFDDYIKKLFPKAIIEHERSDSKGDYLESLKVLEKMDDPWIFYSPNNDHPLLISHPSDIGYIEKLLSKAEKLMVQFPFVSVIYSHYSEYFQASRPKSANHIYFGNDTTLLEEDKDLIIFNRPYGDFNSIQILHIDTMKKLFNSTNKTDGPIRRLEDINDVPLENHILVVPKKKLCAHFDGYEHMQGSINEISSDIEPVLFIPPGFFENKIKIAYGFSENKIGYTNINPCAKNFSFRDNKYGTDLKISLSEIPLFWKERIEEIVVAPSINHERLNLCSKRHFEKIVNPWSILNLGLNMKNLRFQTKLFFRPILEKYGILPYLKKLNSK